ncbi:PEGA domain-containing protein [Gemmata sp.]|uniref:PEGA domain-containing protein n=1 Tax=Gemmata sp. TaxID=1914242 RepID=UPI003F7029A8
MTRIRAFGPVVAALGLGAVGTGCATVATGGGQDKKVTIVADQPGATVFVDGQPSGTSPATVSLARKTEHTVQVVAPGYEPAQVTLRRRLNPWLFGNLILGGPIGLVIDVISDSTHTLTPDDVKVTLRPLPAAPGPVPQPQVAPHAAPAGYVQPGS